MLLRPKQSLDEGDTWPPTPLSFAIQPPLLIQINVIFP
jgi:hypothetical protein